MTLRAPFVLVAALSAAVLTACASSDDQARGDGPPRQVAAADLRDARLANPAALFLVGADEDFDLVTNRAEVNEHVQTAHRRFDADADGALSPIEYAEFAEAYLGDRNAAPYALVLDADGGGVSLNEMIMGFGALFSRYDTDNDGEVTRADVLFTPKMPQQADIQREMQNAMRQGRRPGGPR